MVYRSIDDVKGAYARLRPDENWFSVEWVRYFKSRLMSTVYDDGHGGVYFVSSERESPNRHDDPAPARMYTVRYMDDTGDIREVDEFGQYRSRNGALAAAKRHAANHRPPV